MKFKLVTILAAAILSSATSFVFSGDVAHRRRQAAKDAGHDT